MKKLALVFSGVLAVIFIVLTMLDWHDNYSLERSLWMIDHRFSYIATHNDSEPDFTINRLAGRYRAFIKKNPGTVYANHAQIMLGDLYMLRKNYAQARQEYRKAVAKNPEYAAQAQFSIGKSYELEGDWAQASSFYKKVIHDYPTTNAGFFLPMYLTSHEKGYADALNFYKQIAAKYPKSKYEFDALRMLVVCEINRQDWRNAVQTMGELILKYPTGKALKEAVGAINSLSVVKLHNYDAGINIYNQFIQKYPNHPADPILKKMIKDMQLLQNKKVIIQSTPQLQTTP